MGKVISFIIILMIITSCEKVIEIDLNSEQPQLVVEAIISTDSICIVSLTKTSSYYSTDEQVYVEDAEVIISDGELSDVLNYSEKGKYKGSTITGTQDKTYTINISYEGINYEGISYLPPGSIISEVDYSISEEQSHLNPFGDRVVSVYCTFEDDVNEDNFYLIRFNDVDGRLIERYYLLTENVSNSGSIDFQNGHISFTESIFYEGNYLEVQLFSVDEAIYNYFLQLTDILFWKRRITPPSPYNPLSNISNGAVGFFAAWSLDSEILILE